MTNIHESNKNATNRFISKNYKFTAGVLPILISMPHNGVQIPIEIGKNMVESAKCMVDTDWYMDRIYQFAIDMGCYAIDPVNSRYVIDLNRPANDESLYPGADTTELCPSTQFNFQPIYQQGKAPTSEEIQNRIHQYWQPYHTKLAETLAAIKSQFGYALLFEAHSIKSCVPRFFDGQLPDFNFGNFNNQSCSSELTEVIQQWKPSGYSKVINDRFKGGYITRHYGNPANNIDSLQLELSQATYMNEESLTFSESKASQVIPVISSLFRSLKKFSMSMAINC